ncbi:SRPBCC family protein [Catellatospora tritici]|uniref:SRPBCC family protein n=1 Tax=Catellatospora tritici TaxID=2851566 RepID=UPI001C2DB8E6|nr:SRPBCC family protein [Catellatospora tritici]MBV1852005.1 SRPBCC family protein [Catellatospora tritici]
MADRSATLRVPMRIVVDRPVEQVFAFLSDLRNDAKWWGGVRSAARLSGDGGVGTVYELDTVLLGVRDRIQLEVTAHEPPVRQSIRVRQGRLPYTAHYEWTSLSPDRTEFRLVAEVAAVRPWSWLGPLLSPVLSLLGWRYLRRVPRILAGEAAG